MSFNSNCLILCFITILLMFNISCNKERELVFQRTTVWDPAKDNVEMYRIPGLVVTTKGTALAFSEQRPVRFDETPKSIVLKRSTDNGLTWSENIYIEKCDGSYWASHKDEIAAVDVKDKKEVWTNIAPIVDKETGRIFFFYALSEGAVAGQNLQRYTKVFYKYSDDDGLTWSDRREVTDVLNAKKDGSPNKDENGNWITDVNGFPCDYLGRAFHMPGPGHGLQLSGGRLLLHVWNRTALGGFGEGMIPIARRKYGLCTLYSDDHGNTWKYGSAFGHDGFTANESRMAELANGDVYINIRYVSLEADLKNNNRLTAISRDKGITWEELKINRDFPETGPCDAGLLAFQNKEDNKNILLYSKNESKKGRERLVVRLSYDGGKTWPISKVAEEGVAWYSDMALLPDNSILLIYEKGECKPIECIKFNLNWLVSK